MKCSLLLKAWVLLFIGTMLFNLRYCFVLLMISASGRRRQIHHVIPARSRPALLVKSAFLSIYSCRIQKTPLKLNAKNKFKGEVCINFKNALF